MHEKMHATRIYAILFPPRFTRSDFYCKSACIKTLDSRVITITHQKLLITYSFITLCWSQLITTKELLSNISSAWLISFYCPNRPRPHTRIQYTATASGQTPIEYFCCPRKQFICTHTCNAFHITTPIYQTYKNKIKIFTEFPLQLVKFSATIEKALISIALNKNRRQTNNNKNCHLSGRIKSFFFSIFKRNAIWGD